MIVRLLMCCIVVIGFFAPALMASANQSLDCQLVDAGNKKKIIGMLTMVHPYVDTVLACALDRCAIRLALGDRVIWNDESTTVNKIKMCTTTALYDGQNNTKPECRKPYKVISFSFRSEQGEFTTIALVTAATDPSLSLPLCMSMEEDSHDGAQVEYYSSRNSQIVIRRYNAP